MALLKESRRGYENQKRLQNELVQREKLATLGNLVAGAAHDINHPLSAVMSYSERLWAEERLTDEQNALVRKIVSQAGRTRDLVADLLSFAQQSPAEKAPVDVSVLLHRAIQMLESRRRLSQKISVESVHRRGVSSCARQCQPVISGVCRDHRERDGRFGRSRRRLVEDYSTTSRQRGCAAVFGYGAGDSRTAKGLRSVLHDQARRKRYGPGPERSVWRDPGSSRPDYLPEQT